jgi:hypothetical protein
MNADGCVTPTLSIIQLLPFIARLEDSRASAMLRFYAMALIWLATPIRAWWTMPNLLPGAACMSPDGMPGNCVAPDSEGKDAEGGNVICGDWTGFGHSRGDRPKSVDLR